LQLRDSMLILNVLFRREENAMKRHVFTLIAALTALPAALTAQLPRGVDEGWGPMIRITPFVGWSPGFNASGAMAVAATNPAGIVPATFDFDFASGPVSGVNAELRLYERYSVIGAASWSSRGHTLFQTGDNLFIQDAGSDLYMVKAGGSMRFREIEPDLQLRRLNASVFLAGAFIHERPEVLVFSNSGLTESANHWGVNFGVEGELPLANRRFAIHGGLEDTVIFWDEDTMAARLGPRVEGQFGPGSVAVTDSDHSHLWVVRLGFSIRLDR
jgi:hypothetical protein